MIRVSIKRVSIQRISIKLSMVQRVELRRYILLDETIDHDILDISKHYNMEARRTLNKTGYLSLSLKNPQKHKNWKYFEEVYWICRLQGWDAKFYIETLFRKQKGKVPYIQSISSLYALRAVTNRISDMRTNYEHDIGKKKKEKGKDTQNLHEQIETDIERSVKDLQYYISNNKNYKDKQQYKAVKLMTSWPEFSPYYLWSIPWFLKEFKKIEGTDNWDKYNVIFNNIINSRSIQNSIKIATTRLENKYNIPDNLTFTC